jgi:holo-[acyl-carrier protein] synthase
MIIGIGNDLIDINRVERCPSATANVSSSASYPHRDQKPSGGGCAPRPMRNGAAKEACAKALGTGMSAGVVWRDMGVVNLPSGKPTMALTGGAAKRLQSLLPSGHKAVIHVTITDEFPLAQAYVIIEAVPDAVP